MPASTTVAWDFRVQGVGSTTNTIWLKTSGTLPTGTSITYTPSSFTLVGNATATFNVKVVTTAAATPGAQYPVTIEMRNVNDNSSVALSLDIGLQIVNKTKTTRTRPFVLIDKSMNATLQSTDYKLAKVQSYISSANTYLSQNLTVPIKWGAWSGTIENETNLTLTRLFCL